MSFRSTEQTAEGAAVNACLAWQARRYPGFSLASLTLQLRGPDGVVIAVTIDPATFRPAEPEPPPARHSPDFRSVYWYGTVYTFGPLQAAVVKVLWEAWENGTPDVGGDYLLEHAGSDRECKRLDAAFAGCPAWGEMIVSEKKGAYRLAPPSTI